MLDTNSSPVPKCSFNLPSPGVWICPPEPDSINPSLLQSATLPDARERVSPRLCGCWHSLTTIPRAIAEQGASCHSAARRNKIIQWLLKNQRFPTRQQHTDQLWVQFSPRETPVFLVPFLGAAQAALVL